MTDNGIAGRWFEATTAGDIEIRGTDDWTSFVARYRTDAEPERWYEAWVGVEQTAGAPAQLEHGGVTLLCERPEGSP